MRSVELFAGAGGLALGVEEAGFAHDTVVEWDRYCCDTVRENQQAGFEPVQGWRVVEGDVRSFDYESVSGDVDLVCGGPPCQPFSIGGKHLAYRDDRDMFPQAVRAVRELKPRAFIFENVKGLTRETFRNYFEYIRLQLTYPELRRRESEDWLGHLSRLEAHHTHGSQRGLTYRLVTRVLNAADYGVPQKRERVFFVGFREDTALEYSFPEATHSAEALLYSKWVSGEYWDRHKVALKDRPEPGREAVIARRFDSDLFPAAPWHTVRDAIADLPDPERRRSSRFANHVHQPGARTYKGHTGSPLDEPAKTLKAGDHGVPGGENMLVKQNGDVRYFTVRECARLQTFPDEYVFHGAWTETMRQLGNAVPVTLAFRVAERVSSMLVGDSVQSAR